MISSNTEQTVKNQTLSEICASKQMQHLRHNDATFILKTHTWQAKILSELCGTEIKFDQTLFPHA